MLFYPGRIYQYHVIYFMECMMRLALAVFLVLAVFIVGFRYARDQEKQQQAAAAQKALGGVNLPYVPKYRYVTATPEPRSGVQPVAETAPEIALASPGASPDADQTASRAGLQKCMGQGGQIVYQDKPCTGDLRPVPMKYAAVSAANTYKAPKLKPTDEPKPAVSTMGNTLSKAECASRRDQESRNWAGAIMGDSYGKNRYREESTSTWRCQ